MQTFTDLVGTSAVPAHGFDIAELMELTPALDTAMAAHDTADQASASPVSTLCISSAFTFCFCPAPAAGC